MRCLVSGTSGLVHRARHQQERRAERAGHAEAGMPVVRVGDEQPVTAP
jgi:hypothetical protein